MMCGAYGESVVPIVEKVIKTERDLVTVERTLGQAALPRHLPWSHKPAIPMYVDEIPSPSPVLSLPSLTVHMSLLHYK